MNVTDAGRKPGRPIGTTKPDSLTRRIEIRVTDAQHAAYLALKDGAEWLRKALDRAAKRAAKTP